jgi:hypothetical protein
MRYVSIWFVESIDVHIVVADDETYYKRGNIAVVAVVAIHTLVVKG